MCDKKKREKCDNLGHNEEKDLFRKFKKKGKKVMHGSLGDDD